MQEVKTGTTTTEKDTLKNDDYKAKYEELKTLSNKLIEQLKAQKTQEQRVQEEREMFMMYKRMDYLFNIINNSDKYPRLFVTKCVHDVIQVLNFEEDADKRDSEEYSKSTNITKN